MSIEESDKIKKKLLTQIVGAIEEFDMNTPSQINGYLQSLLDMYEVKS